MLAVDEILHQVLDPRDAIAETPVVLPHRRCIVGQLLRDAGYAAVLAADADEVSRRCKHTPNLAPLALPARSCSLAKLSPLG